MEVDEPYDFTAWHSSAPVTKDKKKDKEVKPKVANKSDKKRKRSSAPKDEDSDSDTDEDEEDKETPAKRKTKSSKPESESESESESSGSESESEPESESSSSSSSEDSDDPDTQPPPKSKRKKLRKGKGKKATDEDDDEEAEAPEGEDDEAGSDGKKKKGKKEKKSKEGPGRKGEFGIWIGNLSFLTTDKSLRHFFKGVGGDITRVNMPAGPHKANSKRSNNKGFAYVDFASKEAQKNAIELSDTFLDGRKVLIKSSDSYQGRPAVSKATLLDQSAKQKHSASPTLFIGNLSFQTDKKDLEKLFEDCGEIRKVRMATFEDSGKCKGFAYIDYMSPESAAKALTDPKKHFLLGRKLKVEYASEEATLRGNPREYRKHLRDKEEKETKDAQDAVAEAEHQEKRKHNEEQKAKRLLRQPGQAPGKKQKLQGHQRPGAANVSAQRASQGIVEFKGSKTTF
ncbi:hypothetical protein B0O80DRAFT_496643 [Mortierella sp. GBAus27b]|nr:hypothetical protein B0O80DRAFT_496643 [Mortierella sp. GBAus27b]